MALDATVLYNLTYGLYIVGAFKDGRPVGCVVNTCFQVTSINPMVAVSINKDNFTLEAIRATKRFSLSSCRTDFAGLTGKFGFYSGRDTDKYADFGFDAVGYTPCVKGDFAGRMILEVETLVDCETHVLVIARVADTVQGQGTPMTYAYYHNVIKGTAPKNAPTFRAGDVNARGGNADKRHFRCDVCGYTADADGDLPAGYTCPVCGADITHFTTD